jgi:hypothetical protein
MTTLSLRWNETVGDSTRKRSRVVTGMLWTLQILSAANVPDFGQPQARRYADDGASCSGDWPRPVVPVSHRTIEVAAAVLLLIPAVAAYVPRCWQSR